jgi:hypothetical protein
MRPDHAGQTLARHFGHGNAAFCDWFKRHIERFLEKNVPVQGQTESRIVYFNPLMHHAHEPALAQALSKYANSNRRRI